MGDKWQGGDFEGQLFASHFGEDFGSVRRGGAGEIAVHQSQGNGAVQAWREGATANPPDGGTVRIGEGSIFAGGQAGELAFCGDEPKAAERQTFRRGEGLG